MEPQQPEPSGAAAVSLRGVRKTYGDVVAVDRVSLEVSDGEFFSMLGPSGSGKTTTLRMIAGFELPTEGEVLLTAPMSAPAAVPARRQHGVPGLRALPAHDGRRQRRLRPHGAPGREGRAEGPGRRGARDGAPARLREAKARPALGRPAPAGRARARAREPAEAAPARRAAGGRST